MTEDSESAYDETQALQNAKLNYHKKGSKNIELTNIKHLPTLYFMCFVLILGCVMFKFVPQLYLMSTNESLYKEKMSVKYLSTYLSDQSPIIKIVVVIAQVFLVSAIICLSGLIKQRISVPELIKERWRNYFLVLTCLVSIFAMLGMTFYNEDSMAFSNKIGLVDNIFMFVYILSTFTYCLMTFVLLSRLNINEVPKDCCCLTLKKYLMLIMAVQVFCYFWSVLLVSFYNPIISQEQHLLSLLIICLSVNSFIFIACNLAFVFSLKYDLFYVSMNLQILPDLEYFLDLEENNKLTL